MQVLGASAQVVGQERVRGVKRQPAEQDVGQREVVAELAVGALPARRHLVGVDASLDELVGYFFGPTTEGSVWPCGTSSWFKVETENSL